MTYRTWAEKNFISKAMFGSGYNELSSVKKSIAGKIYKEISKKDKLNTIRRNAWVKRRTFQLLKMPRYGWQGKKYAMRDAYINAKADYIRALAEEGATLDKDIKRSVKK